MKHILLGIVSLFLFSPLMAQTITGTVTDSYGNPFPGVSVLISNTNKGTTTDFDGKYKIDAPAGTILKFTYLGMQTQNIPVASNLVINLQMQEDTEQLNEVVVTALGIKKEKRAIGYAMQELNNEELTRNSNNDVLGSMQGKVAGVNISNTSGGAGAGSSIIIRGITSLSPNSNNQPLFIVDGIPISNDAPTGNILPSTGSNAPASSEQFSFTNRGADLNPQNIESVSILKGPAATALYGLRGANGVVVITTKRGSQNGLKFSAKSTVGFNEVGKTPSVQTKYREGSNQIAISTVNNNVPGGFTYADGFNSGFRTFGPEYGPGDKNYDNFKNLFRKGFVSNNTFGINAGGKNASLYASVGYSKETGIVPNTDFERKTIKLNGNINVTDKFTIQPSITYINSGGKLANGGDKSIMSSLSYWSPTIDVNDYLNADGSERDFTKGVVDNPRYFAETSFLDSEVNRILANTKLAYEFADWFNLSYQLGIDNYYDKRYRYVASDLDPGTAVNGFIVKEGINYNEITSNLYANFTKQISEDFNTSILIGNQISIIESNRNTQRAEGLLNGKLNDFDQATNYYSDLGGSERRIVGLFGDLRLDYKNSIFLNVTARNDWSST
ncbi:MAG: SusC/RagA family TonB-linked outer membrane protein, partial [Leeuwenhoekiella sp.]|nr:SusC/RagA family TonB-linked outer membrane protein [Leeuwenhoekiella sp.]